MITGQIKNQIDQIWRTFWEGSGITNPMSVLEQMTYLLFMKMIDDAQIQMDSVSESMGIELASDATFPAYGTWHNPETDEEVPFENLRWQMTTDIPVAAFIRKIAALDRQKAIKLFTEFISANALTAGQEEFINNILNYVCQNGDMEKNFFRDNRIFRESLLKHFPNKMAKVADFITLLHEAITAA